MTFSKDNTIYKDIVEMWHYDGKETTNKCANEHSFTGVVCWLMERRTATIIHHRGAIRVAITRIWMNGRLAGL